MFRVGCTAHFHDAALMGVSLLRAMSTKITATRPAEIVGLLSAADRGLFLTSQSYCTVALRLLQLRLGPDGLLYLRWR